MEEQYLQSLLKEDVQWVTDIEEQAKQMKVPIMEPLGMHFLMQLIRLHKPKKILEIGSGIAYSTLRMVQAYPTTTVTSIERDLDRFNIARENVANNLEYRNHVELIHGDATDILLTLQEQKKMFDMVFIDAAKGQYQRFFEMVNPLVPKAGVIVSDNVLFRGYVADETFDHPRYRNMVKKLRKYNEYIHKHPQFTSTITPIGDGVAISYKVE
ncbi:O-methyltransferase [Cerasibacillus terrae]|uniref:tRNA 5-hydroxyuridine methyltransferase n=1 Tax=Cerasibacillus terrae TaxID=2498845 RepID=A0A5C8P4J3_9BACI|nr:O-methyltransferase [Cerasibacillus terrae]TXL68053.1 O-methyltransferase [Cerasibacillus terrae]